MITGGNATVFVRDMERAVRFYVETLGFKLRERYGDHWATVDAGDGLVIGLHPASDRAPAPGTAGATMLGFAVDQALEDVVAVLANRGVAFRGPIVGEGKLRIAYFADPDGNAMYLCHSE